MHDEHPARRCSSRAAPCGTRTPAQDEHLLRGCSSWAGSFRTFLAVGRRSAVAAGEFPELLSRPADRGAHPRWAPPSAGGRGRQAAWPYAAHTACMQCAARQGAAGTGEVRPPGSRALGRRARPSAPAPPGPGRPPPRRAPPRHWERGPAGRPRRPPQGRELETFHKTRMILDLPATIPPSPRISQNPT